MIADKIRQKREQKIKEAFAICLKGLESCFDNVKLEQKQKKLRLSSVRKTGLDQAVKKLTGKKS